MKYYILAFITIISIQLSAQSWWSKHNIKGNGNIETITRNLSDYDRISVGGPFEIILVKGEIGKLNITIEENLKETLITKVENKKLTIRWKRGYIVKPKETIHITIPIVELQKISFSGSGSISNQKLIVTDEFEIEMAGSGKLNLSIESDEVVCSMAGSGVILLTGKAKKFDVSKVGSGELKATGFVCDIIDVSSAGSGITEINATDYLEVNSVGSGNIFYANKPKNEQIKVTGSGVVKLKE
jgi:hypothetical protein